jgi:hypothetical protein
MAKANMTLSFDTTASQRFLSALSEIADRLPEFGERLLGLINSSEELFRLDCDGGPASFAGETVVRLYPSDALARLMATLGAGDSDRLLFEHGASPVAVEQNTTTREFTQ